MTSERQRGRGRRACPAADRSRRARTGRAPAGGARSGAAGRRQPPTVRAGLRTLAALGVVRSRRGSGTYIPDGPPTLGAEALSFLAALHKFTVDDVYEARRILEVGAAGLAAERATPDQLATLADEVAGLFASLNDRQVFLVHDINFHRGIAAASGNPIVASLVEMVSALYYERRRIDRRARRRSQSARRGRRAPADLSGGPRQGRRAGAAADERAPAARAVVSGEGSARVRRSRCRARRNGERRDERFAVRPHRPHRGRRRRHDRDRPRAGARPRRCRRGRRRHRTPPRGGRRCGGGDRAARTPDAAASGRRRRERVAAAPSRRVPARPLATSTSSSRQPGITKRMPTLEMSESDWNQILDTNVTGMFRTYQAFAPPMIARGSGRLIGVASLASFVGLQEVAAYTASKAAVAGLTRALSVEWARHGVTVNAIAPGVFETDLNREILKGARGQEFKLRTPMGRFGTRRRARRRRRLPRVRRGQLRHRSADCRGRRIPCERSQPMNAAIVISARGQRRDGARGARARADDSRPAARPCR